MGSSSNYPLREFKLYYSINIYIVSLGKMLVLVSLYVVAHQLYLLQHLIDIVAPVIQNLIFILSQYKLSNPSHSIYFTWEKLLFNKMKYLCLYHFADDLLYFSGINLNESADSLQVYTLIVCLEHL